MFQFPCCKFGCVWGRVDLPNPPTHPPTHTHTHTHTEILGPGQTRQFVPKSRQKCPNFLARAKGARVASKYLQSAQIGRHFQGIFLLRTGNPQFFTPIFGAREFTILDAWGDVCQNAALRATIFNRYCFTNACKRAPHFGDASEQY